MGHEQSQLIFNNNNNNQNQINSFPQINLSKSLFEFLYVIGRGGFGKVWMVKYKKTNEKYALKEMSKVKIIDRKSEKKERIEIFSISKQMMIHTIDNIANEFLTIYCFSQENHVLIYHNYSYFLNNLLLQYLINPIIYLYFL